MLLNGKPISSLTEADLQALIDNANAFPEGKIIDYKRDRLASSDEKKKEFLYDVSSFANTVGGHLIFGMGEDAGLPTQLCGLELDNPDAEKLRMENMIRDGISPRIPGLNIEVVTLQNQRVVIVLQIPRSWVAPHMVTFGNAARFYVRNSGGKHQMDVGEIRAAFSRSESLVERIRSFRRERLDLISSDESPVPMISGAKLVFHIIPLEAFDLVNQLDVMLLENKTPGPLGSSGWDGRYNLDGYLTSVSALRNRQEKHAFGYLQFFRNGIFEIVDASTVAPQPDESLYIRPYYEGELIKKLERIFDIQQELGIEPPLVLMLSFVGVKGYQIISNSYGPSGRVHPIDRNRLLIPEILVDSFDVHLLSIMKPAFDAVWNAGGWSGSQNYDEQGSWIGSNR
ncbi:MULTISPECIES: helix-turn-helix domain-containing protein [Trichocoleus]|uniref:ATP-binding protein n=1 Tax=Trichocoleus desertorum GB2-A4 TaxID=2933944 RepID=A0ABV0JEM9_9CYAN|nr:ATP-binding protein [Trichocoleus sp. FACHB-46]MBD1864192.1 ATP-binding protein [Trichocoleus sp. FACHB-46]